MGEGAPIYNKKKCGNRKNHPRICHLGGIRVTNTRTRILPRRAPRLFPEIGRRDGTPPTFVKFATKLERFLEFL